MKDKPLPPRCGSGLGDQASHIGPTCAEATQHFKVSRQKIDRATYVLNRNPDLDAEEDKKRDAQILSLYLDGWTHQEIGEKFNLTKVRVSQILDELRKRTGAETLPDSPQIGDVWNFASQQNL